MPDWIHYLDGLALLPLAAVLAVFAPGIVRDAVHHLNRRDLPK